MSQILWHGIKRRLLGKKCHSIKMIMHFLINKSKILHDTLRIYLWLWWVLDIVLVLLHTLLLTVPLSWQNLGNGVSIVTVPIFEMQIRKKYIYILAKDIVTSRDILLKIKCWTMFYSLLWKIPIFWLIFWKNKIGNPGRKIRSLEF